MIPRRGPLRLAACATLLAAGPSAAAPAPGVDEIVAQYVAARGGLKKIQALRTLRQKGHVLAGAGRRALVMREIARPNRIRFEITVQGKTAVYVSDGGRGFQVSPFEGDMRPTPLSAEILVSASGQTDVEGPLVGFRSKGHRLELQGRETVDGREAYRLELTLKNGAVLHEYVDVQSHRHVRTDSVVEVRGRTVRLETRFADFRKSGGLLFPYRVEVRAAERPEWLRVVLEQVEVNPRLAEARFEIAPAARP